MTTIDADGSTELQIRCHQKRSFSLEINLGHSTAGKRYLLQVGKDGEKVLAFTAPGGIAIDEQSLRLFKSATSMDVPTGVYDYDLIETKGRELNTLYFGTFVVQPSVSDPTDLPVEPNSQFPYSFPFVLV